MNKTTAPKPIEDTREMTDEEYRGLLLELHDTRYWKAIMRQSRNRDESVIQTLVAIDPFKEMTQMARAQGTRQGLFSLENEVNSIVADSKSKEAAEEVE